MIEIDGVELRTAAQWEKKHRHVKKGQLGKGVERTWRSPNGNTTAMFYNIEQTRPWAKKDVEAVNRRRRADEQQVAWAGSVMCYSITCNTRQGGATWPPRSHQ